nr:hypothetical protein [Tanacetum cinerariifolium]
DKIGFQAQEQLKQPGVGVGPDVLDGRVHLLGGPGLQAPVFVVEEDAAVLHRGRLAAESAGREIQAGLAVRCHVGPPVPGRHAQPARELKHAKGRAAPVAAG